MAARMREQKLLDTLPVINQKWLKDQLVVECANLFEQDGFDELHLQCPQATELVALVALSGPGVQSVSKSTGM